MINFRYATIIEFNIRCLPDDSLTAELRAIQRNSLTLFAPEAVTMSAEALRAHNSLPDAYITALNDLPTPLKAARGACPDGRGGRMYERVQRVTTSVARRIGGLG